MTLWGGRFRGEMDEQFARFQSSFSYDRRLLPYELKGSKAWAFALVRAGVLEESEARSIARGLKAIREQAEQDPSWLEKLPEEDIHTFVEARLFEAIGEPALRLHTGRSRNDQIALDLRLFIKDACYEIRRGIHDLGFELVMFAERHEDAVIPGYTHMRRAQPILLAHFLLAYVEMLLRDMERFAGARDRADVMPLGSGALAGSAYPVDRERLARKLGFREASANSLDTVSDRDSVLDVLSASSILTMHLSRLCEDLILYSSAEFGFLFISDDVSTGSSIMPQKKNPDALELVRGKSGRVLGNLTGLLATMKSLPMAYNRDLQEDKEPLFDTVDTVLSCLTVMRTVVAGLEVDRARCHEAATGDFATATDLADYLVRKGVPFRTAHRYVGRAVLQCLETGHTLDTLPIEAYEAISDQFEEDLFEAITLEESLASRAVRGGTAPLVVSVALKHARQRLIHSQ